MRDVLSVEERGLHCDAGDFFVDPWKPVKHAVITHGHSDHARPGSEVYYCDPNSVPILEKRLPGSKIVAVEPDETHSIGGAEFSFHPAGHVLGSAQVRVESADGVWVVSGDYKRQSDRTCQPFEPVPCDVFVTEATFALPIYRWDPTEYVVGQILDWWNTNRDLGRTSVLFGYSLGKSQRILAELATRVQRPVWVHGAIENLNEVYRGAGIDIGETRLVVEAPADEKFKSALVIAPPGANTPGFMKRFHKPQTAFASGWMRVRGIRRRRSHDRGFVMSDHVDWPGLLKTIEQVGPKRVLVTHGRTDVLVRYLNEQGTVEAAPLQTEYGAEDD